jgi:hypothetical protein
LDRNQFVPKTPGKKICKYHGILHEESKIYTAALENRLLVIDRGKQARVVDADNLAYS